ncbi:MAG: hypothetical protein O7E52_25415, partial [Candidatus Poribacteria bacterium]|nr:hypothetical protein [Candidatus Poribacteria bacterium]
TTHPRAGFEVSRGAKHLICRDASAKPQNDRKGSFPNQNGIRQKQTELTTLRDEQGQMLMRLEASTSQATQMCGPCLKHY